MSAPRGLTGGWHLITGEYPPAPGGVSDHTRLMAAALAAAGDEVHVWCPRAAGDPPADAGVTVHADAGSFSRADLGRLDALLDRRPRPRRLVLQWVPQSFGQAGMNLRFCAWIDRRARGGDELYVVAHEAYIHFRAASGWKERVAALVQRAMVTLVLRHAKHVIITTPAWEKALRRFAFRRSLPFDWQPVPSNLPVAADEGAAAALRAALAPNGETLVGHFGTYGSHTAGALSAVLPELLKSGYNQRLLLLGRGASRFREGLLSQRPDLPADRLLAVGGIAAGELSAYLRACDVMVQPYPDGLTARRSSAIAALAHGTPLVSTRGYLTEPIWEESGAAVLAPVGEPAAMAELVRSLTADAGARARMATASRALYVARFSTDRAVSALRRAAGLEG